MRLFVKHLMCVSICLMKKMAGLTSVVLYFVCHPANAQDPRAIESILKSRQDVLTYFSSLKLKNNTLIIFGTSHLFNEPIWEWIRQLKNKNPNLNCGFYEENIISQHALSQFMENKIKYQELLSVRNKMQSSTVLIDFFFEEELANFSKDNQIQAFFIDTGGSVTKRNQFMAKNLLRIFKQKCKIAFLIVGRQHLITRFQEDLPTIPDILTGRIKLIKIALFDPIEFGQNLLKNFNVSSEVLTKELLSKPSFIIQTPAAIESPLFPEEPGEYIKTIYDDEAREINHAIYWNDLDAFLIWGDNQTDS